MSAFKITTDVLFILGLLLCADSDRRIHEIPHPFLWGIALLGILRFGHAIGSNASVWPFLCAIPLFVILLICWNRGQIGGGDVKLMTLICFYLGIFQTVMAYAVTALILAAWTLVRILRKKGKPHARIALAPSLALGCIGAMVGQYVLTVL